MCSSDLLAICMSSLGKCLFRSSACFSTGVCVCLCFFELYELFVYFENQSLIGHIICKFSPSSQFVFSFYLQFTSLIKSHLFIFAFMSIALGD